MAESSSRLRTIAYTEELEEAASRLVTMLEGCSPVEWRSAGPKGSHSVGMRAHCLALNFATATALIAVMAAGGSLPLGTTDALHATAAPPAAAPAPTDPAETIDLLRTTAAAVGQVISGMSDERLARADHGTLLDGQAASAELLIETLVLGPLHDSLAAIQAAIRGAPRTPGGIGKI